MGGAGVFFMLVSASTRGFGSLLLTLLALEIKLNDIVVKAPYIGQYLWRYSPELDAFLNELDQQIIL